MGFIKFKGQKPNKIIVMENGSPKVYKYGLNEVRKAIIPDSAIESWDITTTVEYGTSTGDVSIPKGTGYVARIRIIPIRRHQLPDAITVSNAEFTYNSATGEIVVYNATDDVAISVFCPDYMVSPILATNPWSVIRDVCEDGDAPNYWALGDAKTVVTNELEREWRIADMSGLYNKHVVFAMWNRSEATKAWDAGSVNGYADADVITDLAVGGDYYAEFVDDELGEELTDTTVSFAEGGTVTTLGEKTQKLFLPAEKEITATHHYSVQEEFDALTTYAYFLANDNNAFRVRHKASDPTGTTGISWWTRSPYSGDAYNVVCVGNDGGINGNYAGNTSLGVAPCFSF